MPMAILPKHDLDRRAVPMPQVLDLVEALQQRGHPLDKILSETGLVESDLANLELRVSYRQRIQQLENMLALAGTDGFWLATPRETTIADFGLLGYAMMSSATLEQAIQIAVKYHKMAGVLFDLSFTKDDAGNVAVLRLNHLLVEGLAAQFVVEDLFMGIAPLISLLTARPFQPQEIFVSYPETDYAARYPEAFHCSVRFDQTHCEYRFGLDLLEQPLAEADSNTAKICEQSCRKILNQMEIGADIVSQICHLLISTPGEFPKLEAIAGKLLLGTRTLRRRLKGLGTSYQKILDDVKKELAVEYLQTTSLSVQEISDLLGYSEVTNFRRAFVKWVHISPYQYRKSLERDQAGRLG
ncbi:AraC family transcriptional regulator [Pseudomonadales bacterium]|nr:AraC family transcriptional regulator [Pseudomonadales bacterium]